MDWPGLRFFTTMPDGAQLLLNCSHIPGLVALSYAVACLAGYATLSFAERACHAERIEARRNWCAVGALSLGGGVWSMHFIAMLAFQAPVAVTYDVPTTITSLLIVLLAALLAMPCLARRQPSLPQQLRAALCIGIGIALMHYCGMAAIRSQAQLYYRPGLFTLSVLVSIAASFAAMQLMLFFRTRQGSVQHLLHAAASLVLGGAIAAMHFTGMWALEMVVPAGTALQLQSTSNTLQLALSIGLIALCAIGSGLGAAWADRKLQDKEHDLSRVNSLLKQLSQARASLQQVAHFDPLTNLMNRRSFNEAFTERLRKHAQKSRPLALMFLDIDHFKRINDSLGHDAGDQLLKEVAERIRSTLRDRDLVARFGGDEFCILASLGSVEEVRSLAQRIMTQMKQPITLARRQMTMTTSIGIALYPRDGNSCEELLKHADLALYQSKGNGRNTLHFFSEHLRSKVNLELELEEELRQALKTGSGLHLHYQPILELGNARITKVEALIRWQHPRLGLLAPDHFINIAEANGFISELDAWVLHQACYDIHQLGPAYCDLHVAVNCSALNLSHDNLPDEVEQALDTSGLAAQRLELELTENALMSNVTQALGLLQRIRQLGVAISIDDFGTGYSSLAYLKRLPLDTLKIDRSFMLELPNSHTDRQIVQAIIGMARPLNLQVVAEGVESAAQLELLRQLRCDFIQGYLLSKPLPLDDLRCFLDEFKAGHTGERKLLEGQQPTDSSTLKPI